MASTNPQTASDANERAEMARLAELTGRWPGASMHLSAQTPLRLDAESGIFLVTSGRVNVFCVDSATDATSAANPIETGERPPPGRRHFLMQILAGEVLLGLPAIDGRAVIAVGGLDAIVRRAEDAAAHLGTLPIDAAFTLVAAWWRHLDDAAGTHSEIATDASMTSGSPTEMLQKSALATRLSQAAIAIAARLERERTARLAGFSETWLGSRLAVEQGLGKLADLLRAAAPTSTVPADALMDSALVRVVRCVAGAAGIELAQSAELGRASELDALLSGLEVNSRKVLLRDDWWRHDNGPLIGAREDGRPVALLPAARGNAYDLHDPDGAKPVRVTAALADTLGKEASMLYRRLPDRPLDGKDLWQFASKGAAGDVKLLMLMGVAAAALAMLTPIATGMLIESIIPRAAYFQHWQLVAALLAAATGAAGFELTKGFAMLRIEARIDAGLQAALFDRLLRLPVGFFRNYTAGDLGDRTLGIQTIRENLSMTVTVAVLAALFSLVSLVVMFWYSWQLSLVGIAIVLVVLAISAWFGQYQLREERQRIRHQGRVEGLVLQFIVGVTKLRAAAAEARAFAVWAEAYRHQKQRFANAQRAANVQEIVQSCAPVLASALLFAAMIWLLKRSAIELNLENLVSTTSALVRPDAEPGKVLSAADMLAFNAAFGQFLQAMIGMTLALTKAVGVIPLFERLRPVLEELPEGGGHRQAPGRLQGSIEFADVTFRYLAEGPPLLDRVSLRIEPGQFIAIVGPSGSGKSTLMRLMMGFEAPEHGEIFFDGKPLAGLDLAALRGTIGVVLQSGRIAAGSMFSNIAGSARITQEGAMEAARLVGFDDDIDAMPMGIHTVLQEGGATLSGGQRQRLLLARAVARKPSILLLDEATSALDNKTQTVVMTSLRRLRITRVVIAHRLSTIKDADQILVVKNGGIIEQGNFETLMANPGAFAELAGRQLP